MHHMLAEAWKAIPKDPFMLHFFALLCGCGSTAWQTGMSADVQNTYT